MTEQLSPYEAGRRAAADMKLTPEQAERIRALLIPALAALKERRAS